MEKILVFGALALSWLLLSACSSSSSRFAKEDVFGIDHEYVAAVENNGHRKSVRIMWINPPAMRAVPESEINR